MSQGIGGVGGSGSVSGVGSLGTCTSVNFIFAKLQMELAASAKDSALGYIKQIESAQKTNNIGTISPLHLPTLFSSIDKSSLTTTTAYYPNQSKRRRL